MARTLRTLLDERASALPGRHCERTLLLELVEREWPLFAVVHGIAGVGKSALLRAFAGDARERGARVLEVDCRTVEPTESGFLNALGQMLDVPLGSAREAADNELMSTEPVTRAWREHRRSNPVPRGQ